MKTSPLQFEMLVAFMEQHGDLAKPPDTDTTLGRIRAIKLWGELTSLLNSARSGEPKTFNKWKKVWSDLKNNTKRKVARLSRADSGTGDGPSGNIKLTDLETRILGVMGMQPETGLGEFMETACSYDVVTTVSTSPPRILPPTSATVPPPAADGSPLHHPEPEPPFKFEVIVSDAENRCENSEPWNQPGTSGQFNFESPQTSPRGSTRRTHRNPPRRSLSSADTGQNHCSLHSNSEWRKFKRDKHYAHLERDKERNRIRLMELQTQKEWIGLGQRFLDIFSDFVDKFKQ